MDTEIIDNEMKLTGRISPVQYSQEVQKLDIAVPVVAGACHCALVNGQGGQQGLRPVPDILKLSPGRSARSHGFVRRLSAKGLHPGLFVHTEHERALRRVKIQSNNLCLFSLEIGILTVQPHLLQVRLDPLSRKHPVHRNVRDAANVFSQLPRAPVGCSFWRSACFGSDLQSRVRPVDARAAPAGRITKTIKAISGEPRTPLNHNWLAYTKHIHDLLCREHLVGKQYYTCSQNRSLFGRVCPNNTIKFSPLLRRQIDSWKCSRHSASYLFL